MGNPPGNCTGPLDVQFVLKEFMVIVPVGVTVQLCVALPPEVVAVTVKLFETRD
jgi:hypothetical protein